MTLTGFAADLRQRNGQVLLRRLLAVGAMLAGAWAGAALVQGAGAGWALALALLLVAVVCAGAWVFGRRPGGWQARRQ
jgi:fatty acid desaturase